MLCCGLMLSSGCADSAFLEVWAGTVTICISTGSLGRDKKLSTDGWYCDGLGSARRDQAANQSQLLLVPDLEALSKRYRANQGQMLLV